MKFPIRDIDEHAGELVNLIINGFYYISDNDQWNQPLAHLNMAAGIKAIEFDRIRFDHQFGMCSEADNSVCDQNELEMNLVTSLCRFNFIWSALETIIDIVVPPNLIQEPRGKINNTCFFLKKYFPNEVSFPEYGDTICELQQTANKTLQYGKIINDNFFYANHISTSGMGIFLAYKLRNKLVHGSLPIPTSLREEEENKDQYIVNLCSRLVLFTIQILAIIYWKDKFPVVELKGEEIDIYTEFTNIHYKIDISIIPVQLDLFNMNLIR